MKIKKIIDGLIIPTKAYKNDAGWDVYAPYDLWLFKGEYKQIKLGFAIEIAENEVCIMSERSGMAINHGITSIGNVIDAGYRGEISIILLNSGHFDYYMNKGDKIGQMLILKLGNQDLTITNELSATERNLKAHFSSGS